MKKWMVCILMSLALAVPAFAQDGSWRSIDEDSLTMLAIAPDAARSGNIRSARVGYFHAFTRSYGAQIYGNSSSADYGITQMEFDCSTKGLSRSVGYKNYLLNQSNPVVTNTDVRDWNKPFMNDSAYKLWDVACGVATHGTPIKGSYAQIVADYRARASARKAEQQRANDAKKAVRLERIRSESRARALLNLVPETKLDAITKSKHWHSISANQLAVVAFDLHGANVEGDTAVTSGVMLFPSTQDLDEGITYDFTVERWEYDCNVRGKRRSTAMAIYLKGETAPEAAVTTPDNDWDTAKAGSFDMSGWESMCEAEKPNTALPREHSFNQLLDWYRNQLK